MRLRCFPMIFCCVLLLAATCARAAIDTWIFDSDQQEQRYRTLVSELRCPKCEGQSIGDSNAPVANDLRGVVYRQLKQGWTDQQIADFMVERYGEFVLYRPRMGGSTLLLWCAPLVFFALALSTVIWIASRTRHPGRGKPWHSS
ncbi:MAG: cytochrome c-type biogenesis protein CcmH [Kistimonas sp.]|nr:cytochrome c-type biogenesis protein CcmH [Kistimonas sp.]